MASFNRSCEFNVMALLSLWLALVFVVPAGSSAILESVYPTPTRLAYLAEARETENETRLSEAEIANQFILDHPELLTDAQSEMPAFLRSSFLVTSRVDEATRPIMEQFEAAAGQRENSLALVRYLSPAIISHGVFNDLAGTSSARHQAYMAQVRGFKAELASRVGPGIVAGQTLSLAEYDNLQPFVFEDQSPGNLFLRHLPAAIFVLLLSAWMTFRANVQLQRSGL